jgi:hypothetical protein
LLQVIKTFLCRTFSTSAFALCSAGRDSGSLQFELFALELHIQFYIKALRAFLGPQVPLQISVTDIKRTQRELIETKLFSPFQTGFENVKIVFDHQRTSGQGYYDNICFHIHATAADGNQIELTDGGSVSWTQKYLSNAKERLVISGIGSERLCLLFDNAI